MLTALPTASIIRAALWGFGQLFPFSEFFDNPGQSLIQSAKYLLSWFRIGRYQCPPRKEPQDTRFATSPTRHRIAGCERSVRAVRFPETQVSIVSIALRGQLIHNILVWRAVQRESLSLRLCYLHICTHRHIYLWNSLCFKGDLLWIININPPHTLVWGCWRALCSTEQL